MKNLNRGGARAAWAGVFVVAAGMVIAGVVQFSQLQAQQKLHSTLPAHSAAAGRIGETRALVGRLEERIQANGNAITNLRHELERSSDKRERENTEVKTLLRSVLRQVTR